MLLWSAVFAGYVGLGATLQALPRYVTEHSVTRRQQRGGP